MLLEVGFEKVKSWECLYVHRNMHFFLSGYADDYKMAGSAENIPKMRKTIAAGIDLEPPVPLHSNVYLGCGQRGLAIDSELVTVRCFIVCVFSGASGRPVSVQGGGTL